MTLEEIRALDYRSIDLKIAVALGWTNIRQEESATLANAKCWMGNHPKTGFDGDIPYYSSDFDACRTAEATLTPEQWARYLFSLFNSDAHIPEADYIDLAVSNEYPYRQNTLMGMFWGLSFTARQRAEALLFVLTEQPL